MHHRSTNLNLWRFTLKTDLDLIIYRNILTIIKTCIYECKLHQITSSIYKIPIFTPPFTNYAFTNNHIKTNSVVHSLIHKHNNIATTRNSSKLTLIKFSHNNLILMDIITIYLKQRCII